MSSRLRPYLFGPDVPASSIGDIRTGMLEATQAAARLRSATGELQIAVARRYTINALRALTRAVESRKRELDRHIERHDGAADRTELQELHNLLFCYAAIAVILGDDGVEMLQDAARVLYGNDALVVSNAGGIFALWSNSNEVVAVLVAHRPRQQSREPDSFSRGSRLPLPPRPGRGRYRARRPPSERGRRAGSVGVPF